MYGVIYKAMISWQLVPPPIPVDSGCEIFKRYISDVFLYLWGVRTGVAVMWQGGGNDFLAVIEALWSYTSI